MRTILDVGCGTGVAGFDFLQRISSASLVGLDIEPDILRQAKNNAPLDQCAFIAANACSLPFVGESFDLVTCQYLLQHLANPVQALREMRRVSRSSGKVVIFEWDDGVNFTSPPMPEELCELFLAKSALVSAGGGDRNIGRKLYHLLYSAGWKEIQVRIVHDIWQGPADRRAQLQSAELSLKQIQSQLISQGLISEGHFDAGIRQLYNYYCSDIFSVVFFFAAYAINPGQGWIN